MGACGALELLEELSSLSSLLSESISSSSLSPLISSCDGERESRRKRAGRGDCGDGVRTVQAVENELSALCEGGGDRDGVRDPGLDDVTLEEGEIGRKRMG